MRCFYMHGCFLEELEEDKPILGKLLSEDIIGCKFYRFFWSYKCEVHCSTWKRCVEQV